MELASRVIKPETSEKMRYLMRLNVEKGTATRADVARLRKKGPGGTLRLPANNGSKPPSE
jgi:cell division protein FtsI (penicillin-binding protein 3)